MKYDINILADYISKGLVIGQAHAKLPLAIFNYSRTCQYDRLWDDVTLNCRGLILDTNGNVIAKPFPKFFNMEELSDSEIPNESFEVFEKMDGSLGICFHYEGEWYMATRGSFTSEQAIKGMELMKKYPIEKLDKDKTYLFEIIYADNRVVVSYGNYEGLVLLAAYDKKTGEEVNRGELEKLEGFDVVKKYDGINDFTKLKGMISNDAEGYVIRFKGGMRMKIKGDEYVRLHRILTNFSSKDIWELMMKEESLEPLLDRVPDEFDNWVKTQISAFEYGYINISEYCGKVYEYFRYGKYGDRDEGLTKKEFAEHLRKSVDSKYHSICFAMWDGKSYRDMVYKLMKPKYEKPFKKDIDN